MFYHNVLQISENSEGEEGAFNGDSDFRHVAFSHVGLLKSLFLFISNWK